MREGGRGVGRVCVRESRVVKGWEGGAGDAVWCVSFRDGQRKRGGERDRERERQRERETHTHQKSMKINSLPYQPPPLPPPLLSLRWG